MQGSCTADAMVSYQQQGKRSYYLASTLTDRNDEGYVFRRLSDQFELCAFGLSRVRREWEKFKTDGPSPGFARPVVV
jgi:hypothetical protein